MAVLGFRKNSNVYSLITIRAFCTHPFEYLHRKGFCSGSNELNGRDSILPVLIVGAGPVGLVLSILLTKLGTFHQQSLHGGEFVILDVVQKASLHGVHRVINHAVGSVLPNGLQRGILDGIFILGRAQLSDFILNEKNPLGYSRLAKLRRIFDEGKSLQLQFPAEDLGFRYGDGAVIPNGNRKLYVPETPTGRRRDYVPSADPGARLPHMNVRALSNLFREDTFSTLDLVSGDKIEFLLIIAPVGAVLPSSSRCFQGGGGIQSFCQSMCGVATWYR